MKKKYNTCLHRNNRKISIKMIYLFVFVFSLFFFDSCQNEVKPRCKDCLILRASLDEEEIPLDRLFDKIEIIHLETTDNSLIQSYSKYDWLDNKHYVLDDTQAILFMFDDDGTYLDRIAKKGQGPGEYTLIHDFTLNPQRGQIEMLSPHRYIYCYDFKGNFIKKYDLTFLGEAVSNIQGMQILDEENYIMWSNPQEKYDGISIISQETGKLVNSFWQDLFIINHWSSNVFYQYNNETYFGLPLYNTVYKVTKEGVAAAYEWHFGNKTMDIRRHKISTGMYNYNTDVKNLIEKLNNGEILYDVRQNYQNRQYYYVQLRFKFNKEQTRKHLFYNKKTGVSCFFKSPSEGIRFEPLYFSDEYIIGLLRYNDKDKLLNCSLLDEANKQKLLSYDEHDNPYLIKYYFKEYE